MTITIDHPESGQYQRPRRLAVAAIGLALVISLAFFAQVTFSESATESAGDIATDQVFDLDQARSEETARLLSVNEIPWEPASSEAFVPEQASGDAARAADTARLLSVNEITWEPASPVAVVPEQASGDAARAAQTVLHPAVPPALKRRVEGRSNRSGAGIPAGG